MSVQVLGDREIRLAREAVEWRLLALLFECPAEDWATQVKHLAQDVENAELRAAAEAAFSQASEGTYHHAFGPGGPAPPREASYHQSVELGYLLSEIMTYYDAFAFKPVSVEPPDHVAVETDFVAYLKFKEAYALARGEDEQAAICSEAADRFTKDHLAKIAGPLAGFLAGSGIDYLAAAGAALLSRVGSPTARESQWNGRILDESSDCG
jgi:nitrate reductase assembly molybdenum cofactor insertion protein NarJ